MENNENEKKALFGKYGTIVFSAVTVIVIGIAFFFIIFKFNSILNTVKYLINILQPIILGLIFAYILNPLMKFFERCLSRLLIGKIKVIKKEKLRKIIRNVSITVSMIIVIFVIGVIIMMVVPELIKSVQGFVNEFPEYIINGKEVMEREINGNEIISQLIEQFADNIQDIMNIYIMPHMKLGIEKAAGFVFNIVVLLKNLVIGIIIAFYTLNTKEKFTEHANKVIFAFLDKKAAEDFIETVKHIDVIFGGYIIGQLIDALIVGVITFIFMIITNMPFPLLIAVIIGVTNIIRFFGPFIGAIPSTFIILLVNPIQAVIFVIFIFILQQIDGNIICPNVLGDRTGLSAFWVLFSIVLCGGIFGFVGLVLGVPVFAVFYYLFSRFIHFRLEKRGLTIAKIEMDDYITDKESK